MLSEKQKGHFCSLAHRVVAAVVKVNAQHPDQFAVLFNKKGRRAQDPPVCGDAALPLDRESYHHLLGKIDGRLIKKKRYVIPLSSGLTAELDIFEGDLAPLMLVEVEFQTEDDADSFTAPGWFGEDVTFSGKYHNSYLSRL